MAPTRTLHVKCTTWEQVEVFYTRKLRRGRMLSMKVPYAAEPGSKITLGLELPDGVVLAIDGAVVKSSPVEGAPSKTWIEVELTGWTDEVIAKLKRLAAGEVSAELPPARPAAPMRPSSAEHRAVRPPPDPGSGVPSPMVARTSTGSESPIISQAIPTIQIPPSGPAVPRTVTPLPESLPSDERALFQHLSAELRRMRQMAVHEVLGVAPDADADEIRRGWMAQLRRHHPDLVARRGAPAVTHLAEELTILANRAYDRLRVALVAEGRGVSFGPAISTTNGWLVGWEDIATGEPGVRFAHDPRASGQIIVPPSADGSALDESSTMQGGEAFEARARTMLGEGDANTAQEVLAAALCVYPRSRPLRSLYYVASALSALEKGEVMLATSQLETALAHHEECVEASQILDHVRKLGADDTERVWKIFASRKVGA